MRERRVLWVVLAAFVVGLVAVAGLAAVDDDSGGPPRLPALAGASGGEAAGASTASDMAMRIGPVEYRVAGTLPSLPDHASAWDVGADIDADDVRRLAARLGVEGDIDTEDEFQWTVSDDEHTLSVSRTAGGSWNLGPRYDTVACGPDTVVSSDAAEARAIDERCAAVSASGSAGGGVATEPAPPATTVEACAMPDCPPEADCIQMCPEPTPVPVPPPDPERPADLPSKAEAERIGVAFLSGAGLDVDGADVRVEDGFSQWIVAAEPRVGGLPTMGFGWSAAVGPKGVIEYANGWLGDPTEGAEYPLAGVDAGIERLKAGGGGWAPYPMAAGAEPAIATDMPECVDCEPQVRTITDVRLGLMFSPVFTADGMATDALLVPSYFFSFEDSEYEEPVIAVADEYLPRPPEPEPRPEPMPVEPGGGAGGSGGSCSGSAQGVAPGEDNQPMTIEVCITPDPAVAGEPVTFEVTYSDPDAPIDDNGCGVSEPAFEGGGTATCAVSCAAPPASPTTVPAPEPGRLTTTYTHVYEKPGVYEVTFSARSGHDCEPNPYASTGEASVQVTVR